MIRNLIGAIRVIARRPETRLAIAGTAITMGINALVGIVEELRGEMVALGQEISCERARLADLERAVQVPVSPGEYPAREDTDPLHIGEQAEP